MLDMTVIDPHHCANIHFSADGSRLHAADLQSTVDRLNAEAVERKDKLTQAEADIARLQEEVKEKGATLAAMVTASEEQCVPLHHACADVVVFALSEHHIE